MTRSERLRAPGRISVVLPVYNERDNIAVCLRGLWKALAACEHEILVCYDFDEDTTLAAIAQMPDAPPSVRLVKNTLGRGAPNAIRAGFQAAQGDVVVTTMADLSDPPEVILAMAEKIRAGADVVAGSRYAVGGSQTGGPRLKRALSECAGKSLACIAGLGTSDATSNFRAYSRRFLDRVTIESRAGFEIALELTVKAHLSGHRVDEVPSSWVDRTAGQSRFRLWKWMPNYLRWYMRAALAPIVVWSVWAALVASAVLATRGSGSHRAVELAFVAFGASASAGSILGARWTRGRTGWIEVLLPLAWVSPAMLPALRSNRALPLIGAAAAWSALHVALLAGWRRRAVWWPRLWARVASRATGSALAWSLVVLLLWAARFTPTEPAAGPQLDASWTQALGIALVRGMQFGTDIVFTYGPLGYFHPAPYDVDLFATKILWWEGALKLVLAAYVVCAALRLSGTISRIVYVFALFLIDPGHDGAYFVATACICITHVSRERPRAAWTLVDCLCLATIALVKFSDFILASTCVAMIVAWKVARDGWPRAVSFAAAFAGWIAVMWWVCGQSLANFPTYVLRSVQITDGYGEAMSWVGAPVEFVWAGWIGTALLVVALVHVARRRRAAPVIFGIALATIAIAFKAGFVRHFANSGTFFAVAAMLGFLLHDAPLARHDVEAPSDRAWASAQACARFVCLGVAVYAYGTILGHPGARLSRLMSDCGVRIQRCVDILSDLGEFRRTQEFELKHLREQNALPNVRERVGTEPIDQMSCNQGILFLNDLDWCPRPVFQSYVAYTPALLELNARFLASDRAPRFVLFRIDGSDFRLPGMDDARALDVLIADYHAVLSENGYLLFERSAAAPSPPPARPLLAEGDLALGEWYTLGHADLRPTTVSLDLEYTFAGRIERLLYKSPRVELETVRTDGIERSYRIVPGMMHGGVVARPFLALQEDWVHWLAGEPIQSLARFRWVVPEDQRGAFRPTARFRIHAADDFVPHTSSGARLVYSMFDRDPSRVNTPFPAASTQVEGRTVLVVHAPAELAFAIPSDARHAVVEFGILADACEQGTDGVGFHVLARDERGVESSLFDRTLDPVHVAADRGPQSVRVRLTRPPPAELVLRTDPGPAGIDASDWAYWTALQVH